MNQVDRRQFVLGLSAVVGASLAGGCRRIDTDGLQPGLGEIFGDRDAWRKLGGYYLEQAGVARERLVNDLARRLGWRSDMSTAELTGVVLNRVKTDFEQGRISGPDGWGMAETELQIYAVLATAGPDADQSSVAREAR